MKKLLVVLLLVLVAVVTIDQLTKEETVYALHSSDIEKVTTNQITINVDGETIEVHKFYLSDFAFAGEKDFNFKLIKQDGLLGYEYKAVIN